MELDAYLLAALILAAALLYSSVGHAGASGYLAAMALFGLAPEVMKPTALGLNILVATIAFTKFYRVGAFSWRVFWPLALSSAPLAYIGGLLHLPGHVYKPLVGVVLLFAAWRMWSADTALPERQAAPPRLPVVLACGAALGLLSGLTGVGGGIFLSPLLVFLRWAEIRVVSGVAAGFILLNSIAGFVGVLSSLPALPPALPLWAVAAVAGGYVGAELGSRRLATPILRRLLALVLVIAGLKMLWAV
jgi:uncharacterized membrane protein YfcA